MNLETQARVAWREWSDDAQVRACGVCGRRRDPKGGPLLVRRRGRSRWMCLECWDQQRR